MPSSLRSKIHSGPVNRSCVSVAAIGSTQSGKVTFTRSIVLYDEHAMQANPSQPRGTSRSPLNEKAGAMTQS